MQHVFGQGKKKNKCNIIIIKLRESCWGKNKIKGTTKMSEHSIKLHFYMFEKSQVKHNNVDCHKFL
jgi:hypothetical protein